MNDGQLNRDDDPPRDQNEDAVMLDTMRSQYFSDIDILVWF